MNDKCAAGTGRFIEVMANRLGADLQEMYDLAAAKETSVIWDESLSLPSAQPQMP